MDRQQPTARQRGAGLRGQGGGAGSVLLLVLSAVILVGGVVVYLVLPS
jgi:hypothetical protein